MLRIQIGMVKDSEKGATYFVYESGKVRNQKEKYDITT